MPSEQLSPKLVAIINEAVERAVAATKIACDCGVSTPWKDTIEAAYAAATSTPPNLPLTREQVEALPNDDAVWVYTKTGTDAWVHSAYYAKEYLVRCGGDEIYFAAKPTAAEVEAARKERTT